MIAFVTALGLDEVDLLGFSIGGFVAQEIALVRPALVRRLILAATGPKGAPGMHGWREDVAAAARGESKPENLLYIMFAHTETSQAKGMEFLGRFTGREEGRDAATSDAARDAQYDAIVEWGIPDHAALQRLTGIKRPTLIIQGDNDLMIPTKLSHLMAGLIPDAQIRIYPDAAHGFLFQYPDRGRRGSQHIPRAMTPARTRKQRWRNHDQRSHHRLNPPRAGTGRADRRRDRRKRRDRPGDRATCPGRGRRRRPRGPQSRAPGAGCARARRSSTASFDANDPASLKRFFEDLPTPIDHVMVTGPGPHYKPPLEMDTDEARAALGGHMVLTLAVARNARGRVRPAGSLVFIGGTGGRRIRPGFEIVSAVTAGMPALMASLALELAPIRVNLIAPGFVDTPLSASLLGDDLDRRREELRSTLPIGRVVGPADVAALAVHLMINTAVTGATYDIDGGQQFVA